MKTLIEDEFDPDSVYHEYRHTYKGLMQDIAQALRNRLRFK